MGSSGQGCNASEPPLRVAVVGVPTRDRTESLRRCLESLVGAARRHGRSPEYVVVDGSRRPETRQANRELLGQLRARHQAAVWYAGPAEVSGYAASLARHADLPLDVVRFGLLGADGYPVTTGGSRNALLLHAAGEALLQVDDDTVCRLRSAPGRQDGLVRSPRFDPTEFWPQPEDVPPGPPEDDLLAVHERLLGKDLGAEGGRVVATAAGVWGDPGMGSSVYLLAVDGPSRERLLRTEAGYRHAVWGRRLLRAVTRPTVGGGLCVALNLGLDHRSLLPPFLPVQRNQDGVFGALLQGCFGGCLFGYLPWMLLHDPQAARPAPAGGRWSHDVRLHSGQIIQALVRWLAPAAGGTDGGDRLRVLGKELVRLGAAPQSRFEEAARVVVGAQLRRLAAALEEQLRGYGGEPDFWADDVRQVLGLLSAESVGRLAVSPADLAEAFGPGEALPRLRDLLRELGRLLQVWPEVVAAARELRSQGVRPARPA